jgi:starch synthase
LDQVAESADHLVEAGGQIALLGMGDPDVERMVSRMSRRNRNNIGVLIGYNAAMEHRILGGSDFCLMPSRYEPCGLTQMHAQRYGALPIAHATGGLSDTIEDGRTGFLFTEFSNEALQNACARAFAAFAEDDRLEKMRQAAMARDFSWSEAAARYRGLYGGLIGSLRTDRRPDPVARRSAIAKIAHEQPATMAA